MEPAERRAILCLLLLGVVVVVCVIGSVLALQAVRYVVIFGTAVAGSWTFLVGALALAAVIVAGIAVLPSAV